MPAPATRYRRTRKSIRDIGRELGVDYILEGSVRMAGGRARIIMQLIDAQEQSRVWARCYERDAAACWRCNPAWPARRRARW